MEKNFFENTQKLIHEHDELTQLLNDLQNINVSIGVIHNNWDGPGLNYKTYSDDVKDLIKKIVNTRLDEIEKQFN
jgi:uncharacterized protein (UPF0128 family)